VVSGARLVAGASGEAVGVLCDEDAAPALGCQSRRGGLGLLEAGSTVARMSAKRLIGELIGNFPGLALCLFSAFLELRRDGAVPVLGGLSGVVSPSRSRNSDDV
jgi:hypothetical protein